MKQDKDFAVAQCVALKQSNEIPATEADLADDLRMSISEVREALGRLMTDRIIRKGNSISNGHGETHWSYVIVSNSEYTPF